MLWVLKRIASPHRWLLTTCFYEELQKMKLGSKFNLLDTPGMLKYKQIV